MVNGSDYVNKDPEGNFSYHNQLFGDLCEEDFNKMRRSMGHWEEDDLEELLEIGIFSSNSEVAAAGLEGLLFQESDTRIHKAVRRGLTSAWGDSAEPNLEPWFRTWLGESLSMLGKTREDRALVLIGEALCNLGEDNDSLVWLANYLCDFKDLDGKSYP